MEPRWINRAAIDVRPAQPFLAGEESSAAFKQDLC